MAEGVGAERLAVATQQLAGRGIGAEQAVGHGVDEQQRLGRPGEGLLDEGGRGEIGLGHGDGLAAMGIPAIQGPRQ